MRRANLIFFGIPILFSLLFNSCRKDSFDTGDKEVIEKVFTDQQLKEGFAKILSKSVNNSPALREFIRTEALKQVDRDYDVIYHWVKNEKVSGDSSFRDVLLESDEEGLLEAIELGLPTLTVLVPELPGNVNAETWTPQTEIPFVTTNVPYHDEIPMFSDGEETFTISGNEIPGFPLLIVKNNERISLNGTPNAKAVQAIGKSSFSYAHENFDGISFANRSPHDLANRGNNSTSLDRKMDRGTTPRPERLPNLNTDFYFEIHPIIDKAEKEFPAAKGGWQRDKIYYNLDNAPDAKGGFNNTFIETISAIRLDMGALRLMLDQDDPTYSTEDISDLSGHTNVPGTDTRKKPKFWSDGSFELKLTVMVNNTNGPGSLFEIIIPARGDELFYADYERITTKVGGRTNLTTYKFKKLIPRWFYCNKAITEWDIEKMSVSWKFSLEEVDDSEVMTETFTHSSKYATNFGFDFGLEGGEKVKVKLGLKFGTSKETSSQSSYSIQRSVASDELGDKVVSFWDPILSGNNPVPQADILKHGLLVDLTSQKYRKSAESYANIPPYDRPAAGRTPAFYADEQNTIRMKSENRRLLSDFYTPPGGNFDIIMMPVYKY